MLERAEVVVGLQHVLHWQVRRWCGWEQGATVRGQLGGGSRLGVGRGDEAFG